MDRDGRATKGLEVVCSGSGTSVKWDVKECV